MTASLLQRFPDLRLDHVVLGERPTPVRQLSLPGIEAEVWLKDDSRFGDGPWGGNKVRKLEWILPEALARGVRTLFTVGGIGTHWGLACALYAARYDLRTVLGLVDQPVDDHVRDQLRRLGESGATVHRYRDARRLRLAAPALMLRHTSLAGGRPRLPWYLPAGGSNPFGALGYVDAALEIAAQVEDGALPEPGTVVVPVGSGGTAAGLALGLQLAGLGTRVFGVVVNDAFPLDAPVVARLANRTAQLLRDRGARDVPHVAPADLSTRLDWLGTTYGDPTPASRQMVATAAAAGMTLEPVYTGKSLAALRDVGARLPGPVLWLNTHGPR